jgi:hypothetical protein
MMRRRVAVVLLVLALLATPLMLQFAGVWGPVEDRIIVDGSVGEWKDIMSYSDERKDADGSKAIDISNWGVYRDDDYLAARATFVNRFEGSIHLGNEGDVALHLFIDEDVDEASGYTVADLGADLMVQVVVTYKGAIRGNIYRWDDNHRIESPTLRGPDDWNGWAPAPGGVEVAIAGKHLELKARPDQPVKRNALYLLSTVDAFGRGDLSDVSVDGKDPVFLVIQEATGNDVVQAMEVEVVQVTMRALGKDIELKGVPAVDSLTNASFEGGSIAGTYHKNNDRRATLLVEVDGTQAGQVISWDMGDPDVWDVGDARVVTRGHGYVGYAIRAPDVVIIDGAFGDWDLAQTGSVHDASDDVVGHPDGPPEKGGVDLSIVSAEVTEDQIALYAEVEDGMMVGAIVPHLPGSSPEGALDIDGDGRLDVDGDGVEEDYGTSDRDWDNDDGQLDDPDTPFVDTGLDDVDEDYDNDGVPDWNDPSRGGPHVPGPPSDLPPILGTEVVEFLIDTDGDDATGYSPDGFQLGADRRVLVEGRNGGVRSAIVSAHSGDYSSSWSWSRIAGVEHALDGTRLEVGVDPLNLGLSGDMRILVRAIGWTGAKDWSDNLLEGPANASRPIEVGNAVGAIDPFTVTTAGGFSISPTGSSWTQEDGPTDDGSVVDVAAGQGNQAGYVYLLTSKGKVMVSTRATGGWTEYGQGLPNIPDSHAYIGLATGKGTLVGYVYVLRNDGSVYVCDRATNGWTRYGQGTPAIPASTSYVDIASGGEGLEGYVYLLRANGNVYVTDSAVTGWTRYGQGLPNLPSTNPDYIAIATGDGTTRGSVHVMSRSGSVYVASSATTGWTKYGQGLPALTDTEGYVAMDASTTSHPGRVIVMRHDGSAFVADSAVTGWTKYGQGTPSLPSGLGYIGLCLGDDPLGGYVYLSSEEGKVFVADRAVNGWTQYGQGTPTLPRPGGHSALTSDGSSIFLLSLNGTVSETVDDGSSWTTFGTVSTATSGWKSICAGSDGDLYAIRRDGTVRTSATGTSSWSGHGDAGSGDSWVAIAADDNGDLYALRSDGAVVRATTASTTWNSKGDAGPGLAWVDLSASDGNDNVYALRADRAISRSSTGASSTWSSWATADGDDSWVSVATDGNYVWALRNDGRVDRATIGATPTWSTSYGDAGTDTGWEDIAVPIPEVSSLMLQALLTIILIQWVRRRVANKHPHDHKEITSSSKGGTKAC